MENELDLENLNKEDFLEMAKWCHHLESENRVLVEQLREAKAAVLAIVQQRNSLNAKLQNLVMERANTIDVSAIKTEIVTNVDFVNPEMYAVPKERLGLSEKADRI
jgi:hypothetical protein